MKKEELIRLRPHHGLCILHYEGKGYSSEFNRNMDGWSQLLWKQPGIIIQLTCRCDILCSPCPHNVNEVCDSEEKVSSYDRLCLQHCDLKEGALLPWQDYRRIVLKSIIEAGQLTQICKNCEWLGRCLSKKPV